MHPRINTQKYDKNIYENHAKLASQNCSDITILATNAEAWYYSSYACECRVNRSSSVGADISRRSCRTGLRGGCEWMSVCAYFAAEHTDDDASVEYCLSTRRHPSLAVSAVMTPEATA